MVAGSVILLAHATVGLLLSTSAPTISPSTKAALLHSVSSSRPSFLDNICDRRQSEAHVVVSVDWEGSGFDDADLAAFNDFRDEFPDIPLTHFLNAAYFTRLAPDDVIGAVKAATSPAYPK